MVQATRMGTAFTSIAITLTLCLAFVAPALAGRGGFGGGGGMGGLSISGGSAAFGGGFSGTRGGFSGVRGGGMGTGSGFPAVGSSSPSGGHWGNGWHGGKWSHGGRKNFHRCCINGTFFTGFVFGSFPVPFSVAPWPWDWDWYIPPYPSQYGQSLDVSPPAYSPSTQLDIAATIPREACYVTGCYRLQGDGVSAPFQWVWVPAPPPPPAVIPYPSGRYELRGPSRWEWVPNPSSSSSSGLPSLAPASSSVEPAPSRGLFKWTDDQGVTHWTQGLDLVPERYRPRTKPGAAAEGTL